MQDHEAADRPSTGTENDRRTHPTKDVLYHATFAPHLDSIRRHGLGWTGSTPNWSDSVPGTVYLAVERGVAVSYAETVDDVPEDWEIVVLAVDRRALNPKLLEADANVIGDGGTLQYCGTIPFSSCSVLESEPRHRSIGVPGSDF